jgi:hypothetical protein
MPEEVERISGVAVLWQGEVHSLAAPRRHADVIDAMAKKGLPPRSTLVQGFATTSGDFVDLEEALLAGEAGGPGLLSSEDLW